MTSNIYKNERSVRSVALTALTISITIFFRLMDEDLISDLELNDKKNEL